MTPPSSNGPSLAARVAERLHVEPPWEVYAEEAVRYEVHLNGTSVELVRGPVAVQGIGLRVLRPHDGAVGAGFQASTDLSDAGLRAAASDAETIARHARFPAASVDLPSRPSATVPATEVLDRRLWDDPASTVDRYLEALRQSFHGRKGAAVSFGSVRTARVRTSLANSSGLDTGFDHTTVDLELAVKASGGPEGPAPGEYWVTDSLRRLETAGLDRSVEAWCRYAQDVRRAVAPPSGELPVVLPAGVLSGILPQVVGFRASGSARLRKLGLEAGSALAAPSVTISDDGAYPWSPGSGPVDAEGTPSRRTSLVERGTVRATLYDSLHAAAFGERSTGNAVRAGFGPRPWLKFTHNAGVGSTTLVVTPGDGGTDPELCEAAGDGVWVQQLGWANPDPISGTFGGEIRIGYRIRNGKLSEPVRGGIVGGLVVAPPKKPSLLANVAAVGSTSELSEVLASPALLVKPLTVAGTSR